MEQSHAAQPAQELVQGEGARWDYQLDPKSVRVGESVAFVGPDGVLRAALVVKVWDDSLNLAVFIDGTNDRHYTSSVPVVWETSVPYAHPDTKQARSWHYWTPAEQ